MEINEKSLQEHFEIVRSCGLYGDYYAPYAHFSEAPVLRKDQLQSFLQTNFNLQDEQRGVYLVRSGGTTQKPLIFPVDIEENLHQRRLLAKELVDAEIIYHKTIAVNLFSYGLIYRTAGIMDDIFEKCQATSIPLSAEAKNADVYDSVTGMKPNMLMGSPSRLILFAHFLRENSLQVSVPFLLFGGEHLLASAVPLFQNYFQTRQIYGMFGSAESGIWAWTDYTRDSTRYRVLDGIHIEIAEPDAEGNGRILVTNLLRRRFPVFRYEIGDTGKLLEQDGKRYLVLKSRIQNSFSIDSTKLHLDDFRLLTADAELFQIQLNKTADGKQLLHLLLVKNMPAAEQESFLAGRTRQLENIMHFSKDAVQMQVKLVEAEELYQNPVTAKTPQLIDFRN